MPFILEIDDPQLLKALAQKLIRSDFPANQRHDKDSGHVLLNFQGLTVPPENRVFSKSPEPHEEPALRSVNDHNPSSSSQRPHFSVII